MPPEAMYLPEAVRASGLEELGLTTPHLLREARLDWEHGDPWDRILLAQAAVGEMALISADRVFDGQANRRVW